MDKLPPPPKGSPEEIQAWNNMMDTMVTFIKASTHLMNTITDKVRYKAKSGASSMSSPIEDCEPECEACQPKPPCGICGKAKSTTPSPVAASPAAPAPSPPTEEAPDAEAPPDPPPEDAPPAENAESPADESEAEAPDDAPAPPADADAVQTPAAPQPAASSEGQCICSTIRAQRLAAEKKDRCSCSKNSKNLSDVSEESPSEAPDLEVEIMCGCGATPGNTEAMMKDMMGKLANAQEEINQLQEELAKLQRMDASKRTGPHAGPNPAALYREIMKDTSGMNRGPYEPVCVPCGDDSARTSSGSYMGTPDMTMSSRPMMRQPPMPQFASGRSTPFYAAPQPPCRRPGQRYMGQSPGPSPPPQMSPMYGRSPQDYNDSPNPEYWSRLAEYSPSPNSQVQRIMCPSMRTPPPETPQTPKRTIICSPPSRPSGPSNCNSNSCRIQDPNMS